MNTSSRLSGLAASLAIASLAACTTTASDQGTTHASIQDEKQSSATTMGSHGAQPDMPLPPGWTMEDMQACLAAGTPGKMHEHLAHSAGVWKGKTKMWMAPGAEPTASECTSTVSVVMDGRYTQNEIKGDMPGMGPFHGLGFSGFDNVMQRFVSAWIDNHGTTIMQGTGELSTDGKTLTWKFTYSDAITKKPAVMREVHRSTGDDTMTMEMFGTDPKSGKEYKMMEIEFTRTGT